MLRKIILQKKNFEMHLTKLVLIEQICPKNEELIGMRKYNARKKAEREQKEKEISLQFNKSYKSYDKEDVNKCLTDCISVLTAILNRNIERIPQYRIDQINTEANNRDMLDYIRALMDTIKKLL